MKLWIAYLPILTTVLAGIFAYQLIHHWLERRKTYLAWWTIGVLAYGLGTLVESFTTVFGWHEWGFRLWYIFGALMGGAPLAQGTVYLLLRRKTAHVLAGLLCLTISAATMAVLLSPVSPPLANDPLLSGKLLNWQWIRRFSPFINGYAFVFLVGGAIWSAWHYFRQSSLQEKRVIGNVWIALGALLPGIGGAMARFGYLEVLYVAELIGIMLIWLGYRTIATGSTPSLHCNQR